MQKKRKLISGGFLHRKGAKSAKDDGNTIIVSRFYAQRLYSSLRLCGEF